MDSLAIEYSNSFGAELNSFYQLNNFILDKNVQN
jgi:hypothetical protein